MQSEMFAVSAVLYFHDRPPFFILAHTIIHAIKGTVNGDILCYYNVG